MCYTIYNVISLFNPFLTREVFYSKHSNEALAERLNKLKDFVKRNGFPIHVTCFLVSQEREVMKQLFPKLGDIIKSKINFYLCCLFRINYFRS